MIFQRMNRMAGFILGALALAVTMTGPAAALEKDKITLAVGGQSLFYYLPLTIAERRGFFKDEGLTVEIVNFSGGSKSLQAMVGGSADMVSGAYEHTIHMQPKGISITAVVMQGLYSGMVLAMPKSRAANYQSPKDLKGLKIGVTSPGSSTNMFVNNLLAKDGLKPDAVSIIGVGASSGAVAAMQKGEIDAIVNLDPVISRLESGGDIVAVADSRTEKGMQEIYGGTYGAGCIYLPTEFVEKNPQTTQAVVNAMVRALLWIQKATPDEIVATVPKDYYGDERELYKAGLIKNLAGYSPDGRMSMEGAQNVYKVLNQFEPAVMQAKIDLAKTFDNRFVENALKKLR